MIGARRLNARHSRFAAWEAEIEPLTEPNWLRFRSGPCGDWLASSRRCGLRLDDPHGGGGRELGYSAVGVLDRREAVNHGSTTKSGGSQSNVHGWE